MDANSEQELDSVVDAGIFTIPNGISVIRAIGIPLFLWLYLHSHLVLLSFFVLSLGAITDYLDGKIARALHQESAFGAALDPAIDRAYLAATVIALAIRDMIPWWIVIFLITRDLWMALMLLVMKFRTGHAFNVSFLGKSATFALFYSFPFLLLSSSHGFGLALYIVGWSLVWWGLALYLLTAVIYSAEALGAVKVAKIQLG